MPHLVEQDQLPILSLEIGETSECALGQEIMESPDDEALRERIHRTRQAIGHLCSGGPDIDIIRESVDARFATDTRGAPDDFEFTPPPGHTITSHLAGCSDEKILRFAEWNWQRQIDVLEAIREQLPSVQENVNRRAELLYSSGLIPRSAYNFYVWSIEDTIRRNEVYPVDSFEGAHALGITSDMGIHMSHLFDGGYAIGRPTKTYYDVFFHESGHVARWNTVWRNGSVGIVDEALVEHFTAISDLNHPQLHMNMLAASSYGTSYDMLRKLIGFGLLLPNKVSPEMLGDALAYPSTGTAYQGLLGILTRNFDELFPGYPNGAFNAFRGAYEACNFGHQMEALENRWLMTLAENLGKTGLGSISY